MSHDLPPVHVPPGVDDAPAAPRSHPEEVLIGRSLGGANRGRPVTLDMASVAKHTLAVGASGAGKTTVIKAMGESLLAKAVPVLAIDVMGDLSGIAVPASSPGAYTELGLPPPVDLHDDDWAMADSVARRLRRVVHSRYLTPLSDKGERLAINPLPGRPNDFDEMWAQERDEVEKMASTAAWSLMGRVGLKQPRDGEGGRAELVRGVLSHAIIGAWQQQVDLDGIDGLLEFQAIVAGSREELPERELNAFSIGITSLTKSLSARWLEGRRLDWDNLFQAPEGKTPFVAIDLQYVPAEHVGWAVAQALNSVFDWAAGQPRQPGRPRVLVLIDELAGEGGKLALLPGLNFKSASGTAIRRTLRKGRHVGVALACATQNPADCSFKDFPLFNTRFVGRINDSRMASAALSGIEANDDARKVLIQQVGKANVGQMICIRPKHDPETIQVRWLGTLHSRIPAEHLPRLYREGVLQRPGRDEVERIETVADPHGLLTKDRRRLIYIEPTWVSGALVGVTCATFGGAAAGEQGVLHLDARGSTPAEILTRAAWWCGVHGARSGLRLVQAGEAAELERLRAACDAAKIQLPGLDLPVMRVQVPGDLPRDLVPRLRAVYEHLLNVGYAPLEQAPTAEPAEQGAGAATPSPKDEAQAA